jgi:hypothetical protein
MGRSLSDNFYGTLKKSEVKWNAFEPRKNVILILMYLADCIKHKFETLAFSLKPPSVDE